MKDMKQKILESVKANAKRENRYPLSPSQATKSLRDLYYGLCNYHNPGSIPVDELDGQTLLKFELGYAIENILVEHVKRAFKVVNIQERVKMTRGNFSIEGNIDWAIEVDGKTILMDSKSSGSYPFKYKTPKEDNIIQMQLYMHSDWGRKNNVNSAILLYYNKDNSDLKLCEVEYDETVAINSLLHLEKAAMAYGLKQLPPREYVLGVDWQASYNSYKTYDNKEFEVPLKDREVYEIVALTPPLDLKQHVLAWGNKVLDYNGKLVYAKKMNDKLVLVTEGERIWEEI